MGFLIGFLWVVYIVVCLFLVLIILIQRGETGGLSSAFGGGGGETAFGVKADTTWKKATAFFAALFFGLSIALGGFMSREGRTSVAGTARPEAEAPEPATPPAGGPAIPPPPPPPVEPPAEQPK